MNNDTIEFLIIIIILTTVIAGVQWFFVRFTHWSVALAVTCLIALFFSSIYVSLKHASPNGGSYGPDVSEYITPTLIVFTALFLGLALVCHLTKTKLPKIGFFLPLILIVVFAISRYAYNYIDSATFYYTKFSLCDIHLEDETAGNSVVEQISFKNSSNGFDTSIQRDHNQQPGSNIVRFADKIVLRNFPINGKKAFIKEFPFDYKMLKEKKGQRIGALFWLREKTVSPIKIVLKDHNVVDLYVDNRMVKQYQLHVEDSKKKLTK